MGCACRIACVGPSPSIKNRPVAPARFEPRPPRQRIDTRHASIDDGSLPNVNMILVVNFPRRPPAACSQSSREGRRCRSAVSSVCINPRMATPEWRLAASSVNRLKVCLSVISPRYPPSQPTGLIADIRYRRRSARIGNCHCPVFFRVGFSNRW
jgi:hypothetical protein